MGKKSRAKRATAPAGGSAAESAGIIQLIGQLLQNRQFQEALRAAGTLVEQDPLNPSAHGIVGTLLLQFEQPLDALRHFEMAVRLGATHDAELYRGMTVAASMARLPMYALRAARLGRTVPGASDETQAIFTTVLETTETHLAQIIGTSGVEREVAERAMLLVESATRALQGDDKDRARQRSLEATQAAPLLPATWNNLAMLHWSLGETEEAVAACEAALAAVGDNAPLVLSTLCRLQAFSGQLENASATLEQLKNVPEENPQKALDLAKAHAAFDEDQSVHETLAALPDRETNPIARFLFGVAAANLGRRDEARQEWRNLAREGVFQVRSFADLMARNERPPTPDARYPYFSASEMVPSAVLERLFVAVQENIDPAEFTDAAARYPKLATAVCETFIVPSLDPRLAIELLLLLPQPGVADALARFSTGRSLDEHDRLYAAIARRGAGMEATGSPVSLWLGGKRRGFDLPALRLHVAQAPSYSDELGGLMRQAAEAQQQNNPARAAELYAQVLAADASVQEAEHNLGTALLLSGRHDEGEAHLRRSLELEGDYALARCNLASLELSRGNAVEAAKLLEPLDERATYTLEEVVAYLRTRSDLARAQGDSARAEMLLQCLLAFDRNNELATERLQQLPAGGTAPVTV